MRTLCSPYSVTRAGLHLEILPGTFAPYLDSEVLANTIQLNRAETLLDVGTDSGLVAVAAARQGNRVVATDLNPSAVRCARHNMARLGLDELATVYEADLFPPGRGWSLQCDFVQSTLYRSSCDGPFRTQRLGPWPFNCPSFS